MPCSLYVNCAAGQWHQPKRLQLEYTTEVIFKICECFANNISGLRLSIIQHYRSQS